MVSSLINKYFIADLLVSVPVLKIGQCLMKVQNLVTYFLWTVAYMPTL